MEFVRRDKYYKETVDGGRYTICRSRFGEKKYKYAAFRRAKPMDVLLGVRNSESACKTLCEQDCRNNAEPVGDAPEHEHNAMPVPESLD